MTTQNFLYICLLLLSASGFGFTWGDSLARQMRKGNDAFASGNYEEALKAYTEADVKSQANDPRLPQLYNNMGTTLYQQGQYDQATAMYQKALDASQNSAFKADVLFNSGNSRFKQGDYAKALEAYDRALKENSRHLQALQNKEIVAQLLEQQQQQQQEQNQQQQNQNQEQKQQDGQPQDQQPQNDGQPTPQLTPPANPDKQQPQDQQSQEAQPAEEDAENPEQDLSAEEALRILDALMEKEQLQQEQRQMPPRPVEKDW